jgi:4-carboxymuconolactone decarboxylase
MEHGAVTRMAEPAADREIVDRIRARRGGDLRALDQALLHSPPIALGWNELLGAVRERSTLAGDLRELAILVVALINDAVYEWRAHTPVALAEGLTAEQLGWLREPAGPTPLTPLQTATVEFTEALTRDCRVSDDTFEQVRAQLGDRGVVELALTVSAYNMVSRFLNAMAIA